MIPQVLVTLSPEGELQIELPGKSGYREQVKPQLGKGRQLELQLLSLLQDQLASLAQRAAELQAEKEQERQARRKPRQPDWRLIAKHPEVEIRERLVEVQQVPQAGGGKLTTQRVRKSLEDMGL